MTERLTPEDLRRSVEVLFESPTPPITECPGAVGVELELIPAAPGGALPPVDSTERLAALTDGMAPGGGRFTFEPGGQIEYSGPVSTDGGRAVDDATSVMDALSDGARASGIELRARGLAPWFGPEEIGLRHTAPRYTMMDAYLREIGPWGSWMMRTSASLQVNLDFGGPVESVDRWRTANALVPILVAVFANSPADLPGDERLANGRAWVWSRLDTSRTGRFPRGLSGAALGHQAGTVPPWSEYLAFALTTPVMFDAAHRSVLDADARPLRFTDWWLEPERRRGEITAPPGRADWSVHLSTLFPDVRPRRWMEIRCIDVPQRAWWSVPPLLLSALLYDRAARRDADRILGEMPGRSAAGAASLDERARRLGLGDPDLRNAAAALFDVARASIDRFPAGWFGREAGGAFAAFRERYVEAGRTQADDAREIGEVAVLRAPGAPG